MTAFLKYWLPLLIWLGLIFIGSTDLLSAEHTSRIIAPILRWFDPHISVLTIIKVQLYVRKTAHVTEYAILAALLWRALRFGAGWHAKVSILFFVVCFVCAVFAATDEFHQSFVPSRTSSPVDVMIDILGAVVGLTICVAVAGRKGLKGKHV